jgi:hypothetical protein
MPPFVLDDFAKKFEVHPQIKNINVNLQFCVHVHFTLYNIFGQFWLSTGYFRDWEDFTETLSETFSYAQLPFGEM